MFCEKCGNSLDNDEKFCTKCGAPVVSLEEPYQEECAENQEPLGAQTTAPDFDVASSGSGVTEPAQGEGKSKKMGGGVKIAITVVACTVVVVAVVIAALLLSSKVGGGDVVYFGNGEQTYVRPHTDIVLYDESGNPLSDYDLTLTDENGNEFTEHVSGDSFSFDDFDINDGTYTLTTDDGTDISIGVVPDGQNAPDNSEVHENDVIFKNAKYDENNNTEEEEAKPAAYDLYYQKVLELQAEYGEGKVEDGTADGGYKCMKGLCIVQLIDFDKDGTEELVVVYYDEDKASDYYDYDYEAYIVEAWSYDEKTHTISKAYEGGVTSLPYTIDIKFSVAKIADDVEKLYELSDAGQPIPDNYEYKPYLLTNSMVEEYNSGDSTTTVSKSYFGELDDGTLGTISFTTKNIYSNGSSNPICQVYVNDEQVDDATFNDQEGKFGDINISESYVVALGNTLGGESYTSNEHSPDETLSSTQDTIQQLAEGAGDVDADPVSSSTTSTSISASSSQESSKVSFDSVIASSTLPTDSVNTDSYAASNLVDGNTSSCWSEGVTGNGLGEYVTFTSESSKTISGFDIWCGYQKSDHIYDINARPTLLQVYANDEYVGSFDVEEEGLVSQRVQFGESIEVQSLKIIIYGAHYGTKYEDCCISEIEFF